MKIIIEKGDSEEKVKMAEALLANGLVSAVERAEVKVDVVSKSNEEVAVAVAEVTKFLVWVLSGRLSIECWSTSAVGITMWQHFAAV